MVSNHFFNVHRRGDGIPNQVSWIDHLQHDAIYKPQASIGRLCRRLEGSKARLRTVKGVKDLKLHRVNQLIVNSDGSVLGATPLGLIAWKQGKQQTLTIRNGLPCENVYALIVDSQGDLWLYTQCGLV